MAKSNPRSLKESLDGLNEKESYYNEKKKKWTKEKETRKGIIASQETRQL